jgi:Lon protease-like protein
MTAFYSPRWSKSRREVKTRNQPMYNRGARSFRALATGECVSSLLPLFPLEVVLFPGAPLPLQIFEPRYKEMIAECLEHNESFGVVRAVEQGIAGIGCTAEIVAITKRYSDGRLDLVSEGRKRFEVLHLNQERSFLRAEVLMVEDEPSLPPKTETDRAVLLHAEILKLAGAAQDLSVADTAMLSFYLAGSLPLDLDFKQKLLALRSESERVSVLAEYLETLLPGLQQATHAHKKAGGNGHVR